MLNGARYKEQLAAVSLVRADSRTPSRLGYIHAFFIAECSVAS